MKLKAWSPATRRVGVYRRQGDVIDARGEIHNMVAIRPDHAVANSFEHELIGSSSANHDIFAGWDHAPRPIAREVRVSTVRRKPVVADQRLCRAAKLS